MPGNVQEPLDEQPWWLQDGDHACGSCGHGFHREALYFCAICDNHVCCHCAQSLLDEKSHRRCPTCGPQPAGADS